MTEQSWPTEAAGFDVSLASELSGAGKTTKVIKSTRGRGGSPKKITFFFSL